MEKKEVTKEEEKPKFDLVEVPTGSAVAYRTPEGDVLTMEQLLICMANDIRDIKKEVI